MENEVTTQSNSPGANSAVNGNGNGKHATANASNAGTRPLVDIFETQDGITLQADMPGVSKDGLSLRVEGTNLLIEGTIGVLPAQQMSALHADVRASTYRRSFALGAELESSSIEAKLQDGVLTVRIPKRAELRPRKIEIRS